MNVPISRIVAIPVTRAEHYIPDEQAYVPVSAGPGTSRLRDDAGAIELDPLYVEVALRRWERFTGQFAITAER